MERAKILVVDDRPEGILSVQAVLTNPEYELVTASSGNEALKHLLTNDFAVILLDVQMPIMNGFETAALIKTSESRKHIPIIFMSAINQDEQYVYQGYDVGAVDYLLKPFDPYILRSKVSIFVEMFRKNQLIKEQERQLYQKELETYARALDRMEIEGLKRYQHLADAIPHLVVRLLPDGAFNFFNGVWYEYTGLNQELTSGKKWQQAFHEADKKHFKAFQNQGTHSKSIEFEARVRHYSGQYRWHLFRFQPEWNSTSEHVTSWVGTGTDIEDRRQAEESQKFLAKAGELLVSSIRYEDTLQSIVELIVPQLGDWCSIDVVDKGGTIRSVALKHKYPEKQTIAKEMHEKYLNTKDSKIGTYNVIKTGKTELYPRLTEEVYRKYAVNDEHLELVKKLGDTSVIVVPLISKNMVFGAITIASASERIYNEKIKEVVEEFGRRAALAYENSLLYKASEEAIKIRDDFLSIASHELNTPITSLKLHLQMTKRALSHGQINIDNFLKSINASVKQVDRMIDLISVLLDVSRIQAGKIVYKFETFNIMEMVKEIKDRYHEALQSSNCQLIIEGPEELIVTCDKTRIEQVLVNLITNAIKYAPGEIDLKVCTSEDQIFMSVKDHGEGIPEEKQKIIFDRFERASTDSNIGGLGLGLFIVKQIVEGHRGKIEVASRPGMGSEFKIALPSIHHH